MKPFAVLICICLASAALLSGIHRLTSPVVAANQAVAAEEARFAVLPTAVSFEEVSVDPSLGVDGFFEDTGGNGSVLTVTATGYGGDVTVTIGIAPDGTVTDLKADIASETSGVGSKAGETAYLQKFIGLSDSADAVDTLTGATYSSAAVRDCVRVALDAWHEARGTNA